MRIKKLRGRPERQFHPFLTTIGGTIAGEFRCPIPKGVLVTKKIETSIEEGRPKY